MKYEIGAGFGLLGLTFLILAFVIIIVAHPNGQVSPGSLIGPSGASGISGTSPFLNKNTQGFFTSITTTHALSSSSFIMLSGQNDVLTGDISATMESQHYLVPYDLTFGSLTARGQFVNGTASDVTVTVQMYRADDTFSGPAGPMGNSIEFIVPASSTTSFDSTTVETSIPVSATRGQRLALVVSSDDNVTVNSFVGSASWTNEL